jgi:imidazolonepropionase-like amidohydrolase
VKSHFIAALATGALLAAPAAFAALASQDPAPIATVTRIAVRAATLHTQAGPPITNGLVLVENGKITYVGDGANLVLPSDTRVLEAAVAVPGLIDAHTCVGLAGWLNTPHDQDEIDRTASAQPELRAIDAYDPREPLVQWLRGFGVTTVHTGHAPLALISGQTMLAKTAGDTIDEAVFVSEAMITASLTDDARGAGGPGTRAKSMAELRRLLNEGAAHAEAIAKAAEKDEDAPARDLRKEALARIASGATPLLVTAQTAPDIMNVLRLRSEYPTVRFVLDGAADAPLVLDELVAAGLPVIVHPTMFRSGGETKNLSMETPKLLSDAGLLVAMQSGYEGYVPRTRVVLFEAAIAARNGLSFERALAQVTNDAARLLGVADRIGTLEVGKDGDIALFDGDPFEYTTHCIGTVIEGELVSAGERAR